MFLINKSILRFLDTFEVWAHKISVTPPLLLKCLTKKESRWSFMCVRCIDFVSLSAAFGLRFWNWNNLVECRIKTFFSLLEEMYFVFFKSTDKIYSFMTYQRVCNKSNTTGVTYGAPEFTPGSCCSIYNFPCYVSYRCLSYFLFCFVSPLYCLSFLDLWLLITPLVSSNFLCSYILHNYPRVRFPPISRITIVSQQICSYI